jgi:LacI family transcriptional regulator
LSIKQHKRVAIIFQLWQNYDRGILQGIAAYVREHRTWSVFVEEDEHQRIPTMDEWDGDGLIVNFDNQKVARAIQGIEKPIVGVGGGFGWRARNNIVPYVTTDNLSIGKLAAEHLMARGLKHFAFCGYSPTRTNGWVASRARAFMECLASKGHRCHVFKGHQTAPEHWEQLQSKMIAWLRKLPTPIGIMGCYDYRARHVLEACKTAGIRVPEEVAIIGVDNDAICELADPPLSSIEQGRFQIGYTAARLLDEMMAGRKPRLKQFVIPPIGVFSRQSTDLLCVADPKVSRALRIIREQACSGLQAEELADRLKISRSSLDKRFKRSIGRTVDRDIRRARLERATELLTRTNLPLRKVARESGYGNEQYLNAVMRATFHCTPMQYRLKHDGRWWIAQRTETHIS